MKSPSLPVGVQSPVLFPRLAMNRNAFRSLRLLLLLAFGLSLSLAACHGAGCH